jgi:endoglucanase
MPPFVCSCLWLLLISGLHVSPAIRLNQIGFYPASPKVAVITEDVSGPFYISSPDLTDTVFTGKLGEPGIDAASSKITRVADFSALKDTGVFVVLVPGLGYSYPFRIGTAVYGSLAKAVVKGYYFQRASTPLPVAFASKWSRPEGHPDNQVLVHGSAASPGRPEGTILSSPGGWYDAGDYNKYIVNSGISMGTLLSLCEDYPAYVAALHTGIPKTDAGLPDLLEEILYNLRWMLTMQDPEDGGVYHKLTNAAFDAFEMPAEAKTPRYVVAKSTCASLDFAAVMAQAARVIQPFGKTLPGLRDSCLKAAADAWTWASAHPAVYYDQEALNRQFSPAISTGTYGDNNASDEFVWAAIELYLTTGQAMYEKLLDTLSVTSVPVPSWSQVRTLGYYSLLRRAGKGKTGGRVLGGPGTALVARISERLLSVARTWAEGAPHQGYRTVMGERISDFVWGSNAVAANQGILLLAAYRLSGDRTFYNLALSNLDYLLGRNATGYCFVTGEGSHSPMYPHHRVSASDGIDDPVPGLLVGGPNPGRQDHAVYGSAIPDEAYTDQTPAYASNEIAINWNAPLVYLVCAIEAIK